MKTIYILLLIAGCIISINIQAQTKTAAQSFGKLLLENDQVSVYEYEGTPGKDVCGLGNHSHPAHLFVMLTDATITITDANGKVNVQKVKAGTTFWSEAETHTVINSGSKVIKSQMVIPKKPKK